MKAELITSFPLFRLDTVDQQLWRGSHPVELRKKTFLVLQYLVEHPGRLATKEDLRKAVWPGVYVSDTVLKVCIHELRRVFDERPGAPRFIETMHGRGYRFIGQCQGERLQEAPTKDRNNEAHKFLEQQSQRSMLMTGPNAHALPFGSILKPPHPNNFTKHTMLQTQDHHPDSFYTPFSSPILVDRENELAHLRRWQEKALCGKRQFVFVSGEPGVGKTALVDTFLAQAVNEGSPWVARGLCIEHHSTGEPYFPLLDALSRLCRDPGHKRLVALFRQYAPSWLMQMPSFLSSADRKNLSRELPAVSHERMLRELTQALEVLTKETPLIFVLEDLFWCDPATLDFLSFFARRTEPARFLFIGVHRPLDMGVKVPPLSAVRLDLLIHQHCEQLFLSPLTVGAVDRYLKIRFANNTFPESFTAWIYKYTEGNPLFMTNVTDHLVVRGVIVQRDGLWQLITEVKSMALDIPAHLQAVIEEQMPWISPQEARVLQAASIIGLEFSTALVTAALDMDLGEIETFCENLARRTLFLRQCGLTEWPDGTITTRYRFMHALYRQAWYERVTPAQTVFWHKRVGERLEKAYAEQAQEVAIELAMHFERGRERQRAAFYLEKAADGAEVLEVEDKSTQLLA